MFGHAGSANHGCEAIVRSTVKLLDQKGFKDLVLCSKNVEVDKRYKLDDIVTIIDENMPINKYSISFLLMYFKMKFLHVENADLELRYKQLVKDLKKDDIFLSIGGDNYCYQWWNQFALMHKIARKKTKKTVLWSCSVNPEEITEDMKEDLSKYALITARESISYEALKRINPNTWLIPDVAFQLESEKKDNMNIKQKTVGINISPLILKYESGKGIVYNNYVQLIDYILNETECNILLIPHVVERENDDRMVLEQLHQKYKDSLRITMAEDDNCCKLKNLISQCDFFIGARTHATIAAYSSLVPTLVVGYSTKSLGIAKDIFSTYENYVIDIRNAKSNDELKKSFLFLYENEISIREKLRSDMRQYINSINDIHKILLKAGMQEND